MQLPNCQQTPWRGTVRGKAEVHLACKSVCVQCKVSSHRCAERRTGFSPLESVMTDSGARPASCLVCARVLFPRQKWYLPLSPWSHVHGYIFLLLSPLIFNLFDLNQDILIVNCKGFIFLMFTSVNVQLKLWLESWQHNSQSCPKLEGNCNALWRFWVLSVMAGVHKTWVPNCVGHLFVVGWCLIFVVTQYETCFKSNFWHLEFWGCF